jgi:3'(2'), 5'-bisphosphate nucleotidase
MRMRADPDTFGPLVDEVDLLTRAAGRAILEVYDDPASFATTDKADGSPLTRADLAAHRVLLDGLRALTPDLPVLSEESAEVPVEERVAWTRYWLVDPLDGTKEFVKRNDEFTVNVALIEVENGVGVPVAGVVHVPVTGVTYGGVRGRGAWRQDAQGRTEIRTAGPPDGVRVVASRSHGSPETEAFIARLARHFGAVERTSSGSSLKLCRVAEGAAHYYPRLAPTMEWDTAAAQAVVEAAGGAVWRFGGRTPLRYAKRDLTNPHFLAAFAADAPLPGDEDPGTGEPSTGDRISTGPTEEATG